MQYSEEEISAAFVGEIVPHKHVSSPWHQRPSE